MAINGLFPVKPRVNSATKAFSLIEVMMGATVLVVGFIGLIAAITASTELLDTARKQQVATQIIEGEFDNLRASSWSNIASLADGTTYSVTVNSAGTAATGSTSVFELAANPQLMAMAQGFSCSLTSNYVRPVSATANTVTFLKVTCSVTWTGNTGRTHTRSTDVYFGKNGLHLSFQKS